MPKIRNVRLQRDNLHATVQYEEYLPIADFWSRNSESFPIGDLALAQKRATQLHDRSYLL